MQNAWKGKGKAAEEGSEFSDGEYIDRGSELRVENSHAPESAEREVSVANQLKRLHVAGNEATEAQNQTTNIQGSATEGLIHNPEPPSTTTEKKNNVYRVRGLPLEFDESKTYDLISAVLKQKSSDPEPEIRSLAESHDRKTMVAVIDFLETPTQLSIGNQWEFDIPNSHQETDTRNTGKRYRRWKPITIDDHFKGLTVLFSPPPADHKVE
jgi:hypothetical protein